MEPTRSEISVAAIYKKGSLGKLLWLASPTLDRLLGIYRMRKHFERDDLYGRERYDFIERFIECEKIRYHYSKEEFTRIPAEGPVVVIANHPIGGLEGMLLTGLLRHARPDYKVFVNVMLLFINELREFYIYTNPAAPGSKMNKKSIGEARAWLKAGHCLVLFPAGRVGLYRPEKGYVTDETWDQLALSLSLMTKAPIVPVFIEGESSRLFSILSHYIFPMKLLFLVWEFLGSFRKEVSFHIGRPIQASRLTGMGKKRANAWLRMRSYLESPVRGPEGGGNALSARALALSRAALDGDGIHVGRDRIIEKPTRTRVHPEVEDYIRKFGMSEAELEELVGAIEGRPVSIADIRRELEKKSTGRVSLRPA